MNAPLRKMKMTLSAYLAFEEAATERHEFVDGEVFAMAGGTERHNMIAGNIYFALRSRLKGHPCRAMIENMKVVTPANNACYPDVMVDCGKPAPASTAKEAPTLVCEVLSPSTADCDLGLKRLDYQTVPYLAHYLMVWSEVMRVELWTRSAEGWEVVTRQAPDEAVTLAGLGGLMLPLAKIYEDIDFTASPAETAA